jgi:hypothetical protein
LSAALDIRNAGLELAERCVTGLCSNEQDYSHAPVSWRPHLLVGAARLLLPGVLTGVALALGLGQLLGAMLFGVRPFGAMFCPIPNPRTLLESTWRGRMP